jgi:hypothetical protein
MTLDYLSAAAGLKTQNQFNRLHIDFEKIMTPLEFSGLMAQARAGELPLQALKWLRKLRRLSPTMARAPQPYVATKICKRMTWYRAPPDKWKSVTTPFLSLTRAIGYRFSLPSINQKPTKQKPVLVAFCGKADRMGLPLPFLLQALPADEWDVLKVTRIPGRGYLRPGSEATDLDELLALVGTELSRVAATDVTCAGMSAGGAPAVFAALHFDIRRCVTFSGGLSDDLMPLLAELTKNQPTASNIQKNFGTEFLHLHGASNKLDQKHAHRLLSLSGGRVLALADMENHNIPYTLLRQGRFNAKFNALLHGDLSLGGEWQAADVQT